MSNVTAILLNWKRPDNLKRIIGDIRKQSADIDIFLWNNNIEDKNEYDVDRRIDSSDNLMCYPRWFLLNFVNTEYSFVIDDDLTFNDTQIIQDCIDNLPSYDTMFGISGVRLNSELMYWQSRHIATREHEDVEVDIIKGMFMFFNTKQIKGLDIPLYAKFERIEDDIIISSKVDKKILPQFLYARFSKLPENDVALWKQPEHLSSRVYSTYESFKDRGIIRNRGKQ